VATGGEVSRAHNRARILRLLFERGPQPRQLLARQLGLTPASVSRIVAECLAAGLVEEGAPGMASERGGPRPIPVSLTPNRYGVGAIHLGWFWVDVAVLNLQGTVLHHRREARVAGPPEAVWQQAVALFQALGETAGRQILAIGVTLNGEVDPTTGAVVGYNALGWPTVPLRAWGEAAFAVPVVVDTNVYAMALAASLKDPPPTGRPLLLLNVGSTIGLAVVVDRQVLRGAHHRSGFLELLPWPDAHGGWQRLADLLSDRALLAQAQTLGVPSDRIETLRLVARTDERIRKLLRQRAEHAGTFLAVAAVMHDPARLWVTGSITAEDLPYFQAAYRAALPTDYPWAEPALVPDTRAPFPVEAAGYLALERVLSPALQLEPASPSSALTWMPRVVPS
jgi:predicted NBD/HSP70 family sugar kinase